MTICSVGVASGLLFITSAFAYGQAPMVLSTQEADLWAHIAGPRSAIHIDPRQLKMSAFDMFHSSIELEVVVSSNGRVQKAQATRGAKELYRQAEQIESARTFKPFTHNGVPVSARIQDYVSIAPPERWLSPRPAPLPDKIDPGTVIISLSRTTCFGTCPAYRVSIYGNGNVAYEGSAFVLIPGQHTAHISPVTVSSLYKSFRDANFQDAQNEYTASVTDMPAYKISLALGGNTKTVVDYDGVDVGMPDAIKDLERRIDEIVDIDRWVAGNAETFPSLKAEHWVFGSSKPDNLALYRNAISRKDKQLVDALIEGKAPIDIPVEPMDSPGTTVRGVAPVCIASATGDSLLVRRMLSVHKVIRKEALQTCLSEAAQGGNIDILNLWIARGAFPALPPPAQPPMQPHSILADGISSGNASLVRRLLHYRFDMREQVNGYTLLITWALERAGNKPDINTILSLLVKAGASPNERGHLGQTPLFSVTFHPTAIRTLIALGAMVNARDDQGNTPLIDNAFEPRASLELLEAGADPTIANNKGETALIKARQFSCQSCADAIQSALEQRSNSARH